MEYRAGCLVEDHEVHPRAYARPAHGPEFVPRSRCNPGGGTSGDQRIYLHSCRSESSCHSEDSSCGNVGCGCGTVLLQKRSSAPLENSGLRKASPRLDRKDIRYADSVCFAVWIGGAAVVVDPEIRAIVKEPFKPLGAHTRPRNRGPAVH